jgi:heat shock protein HslJ
MILNNMKRSTKPLLIFLLITLACAPTAKTQDSQAIQIPKGDNSRTSLDWPGVYTGTLPCADCKGIQINLKIEANLSYSLRRKFIGKSDSVYTSGGTFSWNAEGNEITLAASGNATPRTSYFVGENTLTQLDANGEKIAGPLAEKYTLRKSYPLIAEKYWRLTELHGKPIPRPGPNLPEAHVIFKFQGNKVRGNGGCNSFSGEFELGEGNRITISKLAVTQMACPALDTETEFLKALGTADNYVLRGDTLTLNKAKMAPVARFEAVYMK